jgi:hypothetical protein
MLAVRGSRVRVAGALAAATALAAAGCGAGVPAAVAPIAHKSSASKSSASAAAAAPSCLPANLNPSARLPGTSVDVSPTPGTASADPHTQISFLGAAASQIQSVTVVGSRSGSHAGALEAYSQGDGASFVPQAPFDSGEQVSVHATVGGQAVSFSFGVDTPYPTAGVGGYSNPPPDPGGYQSFVTMPGVQAPVLTVTTPDRDPAAGDIFLTNGPGPGRYGPMIFTPQGQLVWFDQLSGGAAAEDLNVQSYLGQRDLTFWQGKVLTLGFGVGEDYILNSAYQIVATVHGGNGLAADLHEFQIGANGVAYITAYNPIRCDLSTAGGSHDGVLVDATVQAIDVKTGLVRWEWHGLDHIGVSESEAAPQGNGAWDYLHINSIDPEPNGDLFLSARNTWAGYQIDGATGQILWRLGGKKSSFTMGSGTGTFWQHDGRILADGDVTFFDDGSDPPKEYQSRGVTIALDFANHSARLVSALTHPGQPLLAASQGNMQTLADGNTVVSFGGVPEVSEFSRHGTLLFDAHLPYDQVFYRGYRYQWSGQPATPPAVRASLNNTGLLTVVHMSWNGATGATQYRVLAGNQAATLAQQVTVRASGFETSTVLRQNFCYVAVQALDSTGHLLGSSHTTAIDGFESSSPACKASG